MSPARSWMEGTAGAKTLRQGCAWSAHGIARGQCLEQNGVGRGRLQEKRQEGQVTWGLGGHGENLTLSEMRLCFRLVSRGGQPPDLVRTGSPGCCAEKSLRDARAEAGRGVCKATAGNQEGNDSGFKQVTAVQMVRSGWSLNTFEGKSKGFLVNWMWEEEGEGRLQG